MELMGIADEGAVTIDGQIEVTQALGWVVALPYWNSQNLRLDLKAESPLS